MPGFLKWPNGSVKEDLICLQCIFAISALIKKNVDLHLHKPEFTKPKNDLYQTWLKLVHAVVLEKTIFIELSQRISLFCYHLPLEKGMAVYLNKL